MPSSIACGKIHDVSLLGNSVYYLLPSLFTWSRRGDGHQGNYGSDRSNGSTSEKHGPFAILARKSKGGRTNSDSKETHGPVETGYNTAPIGSGSSCDQGVDGREKDANTHTREKEDGHMRNQVGKQGQ